MSYIDRLKKEMEGGHAVFHEFVLSLARLPDKCLFIFFEGEDDPAFYLRFILDHLGGRPYREHICGGKEAVTKIMGLVEQDGRALERCLFFVDKDHSSFVGGRDLDSSIFETDYYSFENYIVCGEVFRRYWTEHLHLSVDDDRYVHWEDRFGAAHLAFCRHMRYLMAAVLIGRGIEGWGKVKLNLNNANLDRVFSVDAESGRVRWKRDGAVNFLRSVNLSSDGLVTRARVAYVTRKYLTGEAKGFLRGKYELWFFVKFLNGMARVLADKARASKDGVVRATPKTEVACVNSVHSIGVLTPVPSSVRTYLRARLE